jgi:hypothetical protein
VVNDFVSVPPETDLLPDQSPDAEQLSGVPVVVHDKMEEFGAVMEVGEADRETPIDDV